MTLRPSKIGDEPGRFVPSISEHSQTLPRRMFGSNSAAGRGSAHQSLHSEDRTEDLTSTEREGPAQRVAKLRFGGMPQAVEDRRGQIPGPISPSRG